MPGFLITSRLKEKEVSPSISPSGNSKPTSITAPLLMPQDTEISLRTWLPEHPKPIALSSWLPHPKENSKLVFQRMDKPENTLSFLTLSVLSKWLSVPTKWTKRLSAGLKLDMKKSRRKYLNILRRLDTTPPLSHSFLFQDGVVITCLKNHPTSHGTRDQLFLKPSMHLPHPRDQLKSPFVSHFKTFTRSVVSEQSQSEELKPVSLNQVPLLSSLLLVSPLKLNQLKCIMKPSLKPFQETTLVSTLRTFQLKNSREVTFAQIPRTTQLVNVSVSLLKSSSLITQVKSKTDTLQSSIATLPTLPASSLKSNQRTTDVLVKSLKKNPSLLNPEMLLWSSSFPPSPCVLKSSLNIHPSEDSPLETWNKPLLSVSSRQLKRRILRRSEKKILKKKYCTK